ncbi:MAG: hypothetical protein HN337_06960 [Deltaproteobacteria bacterium]|nr:hypothetical protein [Deltaproteobacteria bacterium]
MLNLLTLGTAIYNFIKPNAEEPKCTNYRLYDMDTGETLGYEEECTFPATEMVGSKAAVTAQTEKCTTFKIYDVNTGETLGYEEECAFPATSVIGSRHASRTQTNNSAKRFASAKAY